MADARALRLPAIPDSIPQETLIRVCELLELPAGDVRRITTEPDGVTVVLYASDEEGRKIVAGDGAVELTVFIPVR